MGWLDGKVAMIFGASPNMGGTIAHVMAKEGAKIVACDLDPFVAEATATFLTSRGFDAIALSGDASEQDQVEDMVKKAFDHYGAVTSMVNMAGRQVRWRVTDINLHDWNYLLKSFLGAGMLTTKHMARLMIANKVKGSMTHILSSAAWYGEPGNSGYSAAKAGLANFARAAAMDLAHQGIRVNTITPYAMEHNLRYGGGTPLRTRHNVSLDDFLKSVPMGRLPRATDIGNAATFLASDRAGFITGVDLPVDGGVRAKYPGWTPGLYTELNIDDYFSKYTPQQYGEPGIGD